MRKWKSRAQSAWRIAEKTEGGKVESRVHGAKGMCDGLADARFQVFRLRQKAAVGRQVSGWMQGCLSKFQVSASLLA